ncbi:YdaS family helix-turn-helix protein [Lysobacter sp. HA35]
MTEPASSGIAALEAALSAAGLTQVELAERVTSISKVPLTPQGVHNWFARGVIPPGRCLPVEQALDGLVTRFELRPDVFGEPPHATLDEVA